MTNNIALFFIVLLFLSCQQDEKVLSLEEQFFGDQEIKVVNDFLAQMDESICESNTEGNYSCFNNFLCKVYRDIDAGGYWGRTGIELVKNMRREEFSALFVYYKGYRQKSFFHDKVARDVLTINENLSSYVKAYHKITKNDHLKFLIERSFMFTNFGPSSQAYFLKNCNEFDFHDDRDRFLFYLIYVILSYNLTFDL